MKVLFLIRSLGVGGAERQLSVLAEGLHKTGVNVVIAVFYPGQYVQTALEKNGVRVVQLNRRGRWDLFGFFLSLIIFIQKEEPDIIHSYLAVANIWSAIVKLVLPNIKVVWGVRASNVLMEKYDLSTRLTDRVESLLSKIPNWIICNSHAGLLHAVQKGFPEERMSVIANGIDINRFFPDREQGQHWRKHWNIKENQRLIGIVARVDPMKGYPNFLYASALLLQNRRNVRFICIGDGPEDLIKEYKELACSLGLKDALTWAGSLDDMLGVYNALDILVSASIYGEGFSNVVGEAMACGVPCVVTSVGDSAQLVGDLGVVVRPDDPQALKNGIMTLLKRSPQQDISLKKQLTQRVTQQFSVNALVSNTLDCLIR